MTDKSIYIHAATAALMGSMVAYSLPLYKFEWFDTVVMENGATIYDVVYFNSMKLVHFLLLTTITYLVFWIDAKYPYSMLINRLKYCALFLTGVAFIRMVFHFFTYSKIGWVEFVLYGIVGIIGLYKYFKIRRFIKDGNFDTGHN
jgi:hypothetical protein